jgi:hypothetical protein
VAALLIDRVRDPSPTPFGALWLDPTQLLVADVGAVGASEHRAVALPIPDNPALAGVVLGIQSASADLAGAVLELSNVAAVVIY